MKHCQLFRVAHLAAVLLTLGAGSAHAAPEQAGTATAAVPSIRASLAGQDVRFLDVGEPIFRDERIETGPEGQVHVLLLDESNLTLGPNAEIVVDSFIYNPDTGRGELTIQRTSGIMRFIGGQLSKTGDVTVRSSGATIGIRGGIVVIAPDGAGGSRVFFVFGDAVNVENDQGSPSSLTPGFAVSIGPDGTLGPPEPYEPGELNTALELLDSPTDGVQRVEVPDAVITDLAGRMQEQEAPETDPFEATDSPAGGNDPPTFQELEEILETDLLNEERSQEVFEDLKEQQDALEPEEETEEGGGDEEPQGGGGEA